MPLTPLAFACVILPLGFVTFCSAATSSRNESADVAAIRDAIFRYVVGQHDSTLRPSQDASYSRYVVLSSAMDMSFVEFGMASTLVTSKEDLGSAFEARLENLEGDFASRVADSLRGDPPSAKTQEFFDALTTMDPVLSDEDLRHWNDQGYVVVRQVAPPEICQAAVDGVFNSLGADPDKAGSWYNFPNTMVHSDTNGFMIPPEYENNHLRSIRFSSRLFKAFSQLWGTPDLYSNKMWVNFSPPKREKDKYSHRGSLHWDASLRRPIPFHTQALIYLTDQSDERLGPMQLVPGLHKRIDSWLSNYPDARTARQLAPDEFQNDTEPILAAACDMVVFHQALLHGTTDNLGEKPRLALYVNAMPPYAEAYPFE